MNKDGWIAIVPVLESVSRPSAVNVSVKEAVGPEGIGFTEYFLLITLCGVLIMMIRLAFQLVAILKLKRSAVLIADESARLYHIDKPIVPFSFGGAIFLNCRRHNDVELKKIIRHEYVHVREKHSIDILWSEILCVINWYNPFVWLLRRDIRQNLEFIADEQVLRDGFDKKEYQYLLLKVTGIASVGVGNNFNLLSLKKRIAMMNKNRSTRLQLARFLVMLPFLAMTLLAFRSTNLDQDLPDTINYTGLLFDEMERPIAGARLTDSISGVSSVSDDRGFFKFKIPVKGKEARFIVFILVPDRKVPLRSNSSISNTSTSGNNVIHLFKLLKDVDNPSGFLLEDRGVNDKSKDLSYDKIYGWLQSGKRSDQLKKELDVLRGTSQKPIWIMNKMPYAVMQNGWSWFDETEFHPGDDFKIIINDSLMLTMDQTNERYTINDFSGIGTSSPDQAFKEYGIKKYLLNLYTNEYVKRENIYAEKRGIKLVQL